MTDELAGKTIGERIQIIRERRGKSRPVVAGLVGRSAEWLKAVEKGRLHPPRWEKLVQLADALGVQDLSELTGEKPPTTIVGRGSHEVVPAMREAIEETMLSVSPEPRPDPAELHRRTADAWALWHSSPTPRKSVGAVLPQIIRDARRATRVLDGDERRQAHAALSAAYALAEQVLAWVSDSALLWLSADRCMASAEQADDPAALAGAAWVVGNVWRATGREDDAYRLVTDAAGLLEPYLDSDGDGVRALWGSCRLHAAITAARMGREGDALRNLDQADDMAGRLPGGYAHPWTLFGRANADLTGVSVHVDLRKSGRAIDAAEQIDPDSVPSVDRRARLWLETARAYHQRKDYPATLHVLQRATKISEESMRCHPLSRGIAGDLVTSGGRMVQSEARGLARQLGLTV
ncbi:helix-turn-helix domain-containing protein [Saccharopolyspora rosea]|uniref:helix-turn-helix domain-containing protein n=1 Tax=Saccharopolyspora rosea TaxID=524884 RepID=UPI0021D844C1|nr:transcriptional regulator [Saccharopolyspora rosea]